MKKALIVAALALAMAGCAYKGGKVVDGANIEIGMTVPGTEWSINFLSYTGGIRVCGNDNTRIVVTNAVTETNTYFGVVKTGRNSKLSARVEPCEDEVKDGE